MSTPSTIESSVPFKGRRLLQARLRMRLKGLVLHDRRKGWPAADSALVWVNLARRATCFKVRLGRMMIGEVVMRKVGIGEVVNGAVGEVVNGAVGEEVSGIETAIAIGTPVGDDVALCSWLSAKQLLSEIALSQVLAPWSMNLLDVMVVTA